MALQDEIKDMIYPKDQTEEEYGDEEEQAAAEAGTTADEEGLQEEGVQEEVAEPTEPAEPAEPEDTLEQRYARLLEEYNKQSIEMLDLKSSSTKPQVVEEPEQPKPVPKVRPSQFILDEETLERALVEDDKEAMKQVINSLVQYIDSRSDVETLKEAVLLEVPAIASRIAGTQVPLLMAVREFYRDNSDLKPYSGIVGQIVNELQARNPNQTLEELFEETEKEARKRLNLKKQAIARSDKTPAFAKTAGSRRPGAPRITGLRGEISEMIKAGR
jgi:hypothetical protein